MHTNELCDNLPMNRLIATLCTLLAALGAAAIHAADEDNLLPVEEAFRVETKALDRATIEIRFKIADDYYLYRERMKTRSTDPSVVFNALDLPAGEKKHDEFLGDVEVYHHGLVATQHLTAPATATKVALELRYQGCHQVDPKICFPPQKVQLDVDLPAAAAAGAAAAGLTALAAKPAAAGGSLLGGSEPLPAEKAFVFEAIATSGNEILARFTMPKGYYLYRDKTSFALARRRRRQSLQRHAGPPASSIRMKTSVPRRCTSIRSKFRLPSAVPIRQHEPSPSRRDSRAAWKAACAIRSPRSRCVSTCPRELPA